MVLLQVIQNILYTIMNALLYPVMLGLIASFAAMLYIFGKFLAECLFRKRNKADVENIAFEICRDISNNRFSEAAVKIKEHLDSCSNESKGLRRFLNDLAKEIERGRNNLDIRIENVLQENETHTARLLDITKIFVRLGPMIGLMGTLIPIGGALLSLSTGDITQMSNKLIIAFSTTVVGLAIAGLAYITSTMRERWYEADMKTMEFLAEIIMRDMEIINSGASQ